MDKIKLLLLFVLSALSVSANAQTGRLDSLISKALSVSPKLKMTDAKIRAAESRLPQVSNLPDPTLTLGLANMPTNSFSFTQEPMTGKIVGLSQAVPFPGRLSAAENVYAKDVDIAKAEKADAANEIELKVSDAYYDLSFIRKSIEISEKNKKLLKNISEVVRTKYAVASASQQNLMKVELEITAINDKLDDLKSMEAEKQSLLNSLLLQNDTTIIFTEEIHKINFPRISVEELDSAAEINRPFLLGTRLAEEKAGLQQKLAAYDYYPNFNFSVQYSQRDRIAATNTALNDFLSVIIGISLPLNYGGKVNAKVEESSAMQEFYRQQYSSALQTLNGSFGRAVAKLNSLRQRIKLNEEGLLPQATQTLSSALASYQVGQVDFINVIDAQNKLYQAEIELYKLKTDYMKEASELEFLTGSNLKDKL